MKTPQNSRLQTLLKFMENCPFPYDITSLQTDTVRVKIFISNSAEKEREDGKS